MASTINGTSTGSGGLISTGDGSGILNIQTNETTAITIDASQNVGIGTSSPSSPLNVVSASSSLAIAINGRSSDNLGAMYFYANNGSTQHSTITASATEFRLSSVPAAAVQTFYTNGSERMRIDTSGNLLVGVTSSPLLSSMVLYFDGSSRQGLLIKNTANSASGAAVRFMDYLGNVSGGGIFYTSSNSINYATSSDYRLKENIAPMTGALEKVTQLKPCTFQWTVDGSDGQGFIAHELQAVVPECVVGEKDAVNEDGSIKPQGIDTSFLVATLTAAIQEQQALINALTARIVALDETLTEIKDRFPK